MFCEFWRDFKNLMFDLKEVRRNHHINIVRKALDEHDWDTLARYPGDFVVKVSDGNYL